MGISVCILNYNGKEIIEKCVKSVLNQSFKPEEILIIDNSSTDNSWKLVEKSITKVVHADNKYRFITGLNTAFESASCNWVLFMENDVFLHKNCLEEMIDSNADIITPKFYDSNFHKYKIEWYSGFLSACFLMAKSTFDFLGPFDINLAPAYWEDVEYTIRAHRAGFKTKKGVGKAIHYANWSFSKVFTKKQMSDWCRKNAWYVLQKHYLSHAFPWLYNGKTFSNSKIGADYV